eukprot:5655905-Prymnesium_polylepis.1
MCESSGYDHCPADVPAVCPLPCTCRTPTAPLALLCRCRATRQRACRTTGASSPHMHAPRGSGSEYTGPVADASPPPGSHPCDVRTASAPHTP